MQIIGQFLLLEAILTGTIGTKLIYAMPTKFSKITDIQIVELL